MQLSEMNGPLRVKQVFSNLPASIFESFLQLRLVFIQGVNNY